MAEGAFRHEYKHLINIFDAAALRARLGAVAKPDPNAGARGVTVSAAYILTTWRIRRCGRSWTG